MTTTAPPLSAGLMMTSYLSLRFFKALSCCMLRLAGGAMFDKMTFIFNEMFTSCEVISDVIKFIYSF